MQLLKIFRFRLTGLIPVILLPGCVSMYQPPDSDGNTATIVFRDHDAGAGKGHFYLWHSTQSCKQAVGEGRIAALDWLNGSEKHAAVRSGLRGYLLGHRQVLSDVATAGGTTQFTSNYCRRMVSFIPEAGHNYIAEMDVFPLCKIVVIDTSTGAAPVSIQQHDVVARCTEENI